MHGLRQSINTQGKLLRANYLSSTTSLGLLVNGEL